MDELVPVMRVFGEVVPGGQGFGAHDHRAGRPEIGRQRKRFPHFALSPLCPIFYINCHAVERRTRPEDLYGAGVPATDRRRRGPIGPAPAGPDRFAEHAGQLTAPFTILAVAADGKSSVFLTV